MHNSLLDWIYASLQDGMDEASLVLSLTECLTVPLGLALRQREARRCLRSTVKRSARIQWLDENEAQFVPKVDGFHLHPLLEVMSHKLFRIARRPLSAKELLVVLPITNKERLRWTKDGRLMQQGTASMKRGQAISVTTYAIGPVEALLADPQEVERWRARDLWLETR
jgi:hypothetical protein